MAEIKRFDNPSIKGRNTQRFARYTDTAQVLPDGTFENLNDVFSEGLAEVAQYGEYLLGEKKFTTAQNISSLVTMGTLISRKRARSQSAIGMILVSHTDSEGNVRLNNFGKSFFDLNETSDYDNIDKKEDSTPTERKALVPWTYSVPYTIPKGTLFYTESGIQFISTESVSSRVLTSKYSEIINSDIKMAEFLEAGGWDGIKYLRVPVIQGIQRNVTIGYASNAKFQTFTLDEVDVEDASNVKSREYFYIELFNEATGEKEKWSEVQNIRQAGPYDKVFESKLSKDGKFLIIKFGDDLTGKVPPAGVRVNLHYLETLGAGGNIESNFQITKMAFPNGVILKDPRFDTYSEFLSCTNIGPIGGGKNIENEVEYKENAPVSYLRSYTTAVKGSYEKQIKNNSPYSLAKIKCFPSSEFTASQVDIERDENIDDIVANEVSIVNNVLNVCAVKANGEKLCGKDAEYFKDVVIKYLGENKAPSDSLTIIEPNYIQMAPSLKINVTDPEVSEADVRVSIKNAVSKAYSIFNTDFNKPLYSSKISHTASNFKFTDSVNLTLEALASVDYNNCEIIRAIDNEDNEFGLLAVPFKFDETFGQDKYYNGFKNHSVNAPYLLKVDFKFKNGVDADSKSRTFFLLDNRNSDEVSLEIAKTLSHKRDSKGEYGYETIDRRIDISTPQASQTLGFPITFFDEQKNGFEDRQVRIAQFPYISQITDTEFMTKAKSWEFQPFENRPFEQDSDGTNKYFEMSLVQEDLRVSIAGSAGSVGTTCFKRNKSFIDNVDIIFNEDYGQPQSLDYASGWFIVPMDYVGISSYAEYDEAKTSPVSKTLNDFMESYISQLKQFVDIKVYAQPKTEDIFCDDWNDIIFIDDDDIKVERNLIM